eukprot:3982129-Pleurochrysis_carterae.AAC.1
MKSLDSETSAWSEHANVRARRKSIEQASRTLWHAVAAVIFVSVNSYIGHSEVTISRASRSSSGEMAALVRLALK